jgi:DNA repair protein RadD
MPHGGPVTLQLRDYQVEAIQAIYTWFERHTTNPLVVMPTGTGKSVVIAGFVKGILEQWTSQRILVVTHVRELVEQNAKKMVELWPGAPVGIYSAGLKRRDYDQQITFASIQSIHRRAGELGWFDLVLVDECHLLPKSGNGMYQAYLTALRSMNPAVKVIGFTATPYRTDSGLLYEGDDALFAGVAYDTDMVRLIKAGYLSPLVPKRVDGAIETAGIRKQAGDFVQGELEKAALAGDLATLACSEILKWGAERRSWLVFCCGIEHARTVEQVLQNRGVQVASLFGDTPLAERAKLIQRFRAGELRALVNVGVLTTGFDAPGTDLVAMLRPTCSPGLYVQMAGRGMRVAPGKTNCLVLDFGGNVDRHGPVDMVKPKKKGEGGGEAPVKDCPNCKSIVFAGVAVCPECGYEFPKLGPTHDVVAHTREIIAGLGDTQRIVRVVSTTFGRHQKSITDARPTLRVEYFTDERAIFSVREWIALEHTGYARTVAEGWWMRRGKPPIPRTIEEAMSRTGELRPVTSLKVDTSGKHPRILGYAFAKPQPIIAGIGGDGDAGHAPREGRVLGPPAEDAEGPRGDP